MPRPSCSSPSLAAAVRAHFALTQAELAQFMGVSRAHLASVESGRKDLSEAPRLRLWVLARHLPPPDGQGPSAPDFAAGATAPPTPAEAAALHARLRRCRFLLAKGRFELGQQPPARPPARRRWALGVLGSALLAPPAPPPGGRLAYPQATPDPVADAQWLARLAGAAAATPPAAGPGTALARLRLQLLETEAAALEALLAGEAAA